jgi:hypothetical protein
MTSKERACEGLCLLTGCGMANYHSQIGHLLLTLAIYRSHAHGPNLLPYTPLLPTPIARFHVRFQLP